MGELRGWYEAEGSSITTTSLTTARTGAGGGDIGSNMKTFGETKKENLGMNSDKPEYYSASGYVTLLQKDKALYMACGNQNNGRSCNKKVQDQGDGTYRCEKCNITAPTFNWRLILSIRKRVRSLSQRTIESVITCMYSLSAQDCMS